MPLKKTEEIGGKLIVKIEVIPNYELESLILSFGENIQVVKPDSLKVKIQTRVKSSLNKYEE